MPAVPLLTSSPSATDREPPAVLSYFAMRRAAGYIGFALPLIVVIQDRFIHHPGGCIPSSISASYHTGARNAFIGGLCCVGTFLITSIGYKEDRPYSIFAGAMAFLVAFCPTLPDDRCALPGAHVPFTFSHYIHSIAAIALFLTFAFFCRILFCRSSTDLSSSSPSGDGLTPQKRTRNTIYICCAWVMILAMAAYPLVDFVLPHFHVIAQPRYTLLIVEWVCLWAFAFAWLVKGQQMFAD